MFNDVEMKCSNEQKKNQIDKSFVRILFMSAVKFKLDRLYIDRWIYRPHNDYYYYNSKKKSIAILNFLYISHDYNGEQRAYKTHLNFTKNALITWVIPLRFGIFRNWVEAGKEQSHDLFNWRFCFSYLSRAWQFCWRNSKPLVDCEFIQLLSHMLVRQCLFHWL